MNAIIYCRVSTQEQAETGFSLEAQEETCATYAERKGYTVLKTFIERGESAKNLNRTQLKNLIRYAKDNYNNIDVLIIYKIDRLSRNQRDTSNFLYDFRYIFNIRIESVTENIDESPVGQYLTTIFSANAQLDNDIRSERVMLAMKKAVKEGRWCWTAPKGYGFKKDQFRKPLLYPNSDSVFIKEAFELIEKGLYTQMEIVAMLSRKGFKVAKQTLNGILHNPIYAGLIRTKWYPELIEGIHEPIISRETFFNVQKILSGKQLSIAPKQKINPDFPLRGFVLCPECNSPLTASMCKGNTTKVAYYWCWKNNCIPMIQRDVIEEKFCEYLSDFEPKPEIMELLEYKLVHYWKEKNQDYKNQLKRDKARLTELRQMKDNLVKKLLRDVIDDRTYKEQADWLQKEILVLEETCEQERIVDSDFEEYLNFGKRFLSNLSEIWKKAEIKIKQRIQNLIFPAQIYFDGIYFEPPQILNILKVIKNFPDESKVAGRVGFEPTNAGSKGPCLTAWRPANAIIQRFSS